MSTPREQLIENLCRELAKKIGAELYKIRSPGQIGFPDRMLVIPGAPAIVALIEFKRPGAEPDPHQTVTMGKLASLGLNVRVISSTDQFKELIRGLLRSA